MQQQYKLFKMMSNEFKNYCFLILFEDNKEANPVHTFKQGDKVLHSYFDLTESECESIEQIFKSYCEISFNKEEEEEEE